MILILFLITLAIGLLAQWHVERAYARHSRTPDPQATETAPNPFGGVNSICKVSNGG